MGITHAFFFFLGLSTWAFAQEPVIEDEPTPEPTPYVRPLVAPDVDGFEKLPVDPVVEQSNKKVAAGSFKLLTEKEGIYTFEADRAFVPGSLVMFMRMTRLTPDILAQGTVVDQKDRRVRVRINMATINKIPLLGDMVVPLEPPWKPTKPVIEQETSGAISAEPEEPPGDPGHIQYDLGVFNGSMETKTFNQANFYKQVPSYKFQYAHFEWYVEFLWRFGIEYESVSGIFPTFSYYRRAETTSGSNSSLIFNYRFRRQFDGKFRATARLISTTDNFETTNIDEAVIPTKTTLIGVGGRWAAELTSNIWKPENPKQKFGAVLHRVYIDTNIYPMVSAKDLMVTRGTEGKGLVTEWRIGATGLIYLGWIPIFNRLVIEAFYGQKSTDLTFSGDTISETGGIYKIPGGGRYEEKLNYWVITGGLRLDDYIGRLFNPR